MKEADMMRREFIKTSLAGSAAVMAGCKTGEVYALPRRTLGKTGEKLSIIGFGGILVDRLEQNAANNLVAKAFVRGINYYDVAPSYGEAEVILGPALQPYRKKSFLACKTTERDRESAEKELNRSLDRLKTDHFDLYQLHALQTIEDVEKAFAPGGAMEVFIKAKAEGKVRFLGFSSHSEAASLLAMKNYDFDTILTPINFVCWHAGKFAQKAVAMAKEKGMGILALKTLAYTKIPEGTEKPYQKLWYIPNEDEALSDLAVRFTLSKSVTAAIPPGEEKFFWRALDIAEKDLSFTEAEDLKLQELATGIDPLFRSDAQV
jgi:predicted aldo/keto reductase-like oxidoreductase